MDRSPHTMRYYRSRTIFREYEDILVWGWNIAHPCFAVKSGNRWYNVFIPSWNRRNLDINNYQAVKTLVRDAVNSQHAYESSKERRLQRQLYKAERQLTHISSLQQVLI